MTTDNGIYDELATAFGWDDADITREEAAATLADLYPNATDAAEIVEEVMGF